MSNPISPEIVKKEATLRLPNRDPVNNFIKEMAEIVVRKAKNLSQEDIKNNG